jgi:hypothetical protein
MRYSVERRYGLLWSWRIDADRGGAHGFALSVRAARWAARSVLRQARPPRDPAEAPPEGGQKIPMAA